MVNLPAKGNSIIDLFLTTKTGNNQNTKYLYSLIKYSKQETSAVPH